MPKTWEQLNLNPEVLHAIKSFNFPYMTPVQAHTIPKLVGHKDVAAEAVTGNHHNIRKAVYRVHWCSIQCYCKHFLACPFFKS